MSTSLFPARRAAIVAVAVLLLVLAACGSSNVVKDGALSKDKGVPTVPIPTTTTTLPSAKGKACKQENGEKAAKGEPAVVMPLGKPPAKLQVDDLKVGTGTAIAANDNITVNYVGVSCSTGKVFDSSYGRGQTFSTALTSGSIIDGWLKGLIGMKVGGRRELVIPPAQGYGASGQGTIAPDETLVFVIDLVSVAPPGTTTTAPTTATTAPATTTTVKPGTPTVPTVPTTAGASTTTVPATTTTAAKVTTTTKG